MSAQPLQHSGPWLKEKEVAELTRLSVSTLQKHRFYHKGIPYTKVGGSAIRYSIQDVEAFMQAHRVDLPLDR